MAIIQGGTVIEGSRERTFRNDGPPLSGTTQGTLAGAAPPGALLRDVTNDVLYQNEGTLASPYWTPVNYDQRGLAGYYTDFRDGIGSPVADGNNTVLLASGVRIFGQGMEQSDSGVTVIPVTEVGPVATLLTTNDDDHTLALGIGTSVIPWQPDVHGPLVVDAEFSMVSALTLRALFLGFSGTLADTQQPMVAGATVTITNNEVDMAGLIMDAGLSDAAGLMATYNKGNDNATIPVSDPGVDTGTDMPAAGTYVRLRTEISAAGVMICFRDKVQIASVASALDADEEVSPVLQLINAEANIKQMTVKHFSAWATRA